MYVTIHYSWRYGVIGFYRARDDLTTVHFYPFPFVRLTFQPAVAPSWLLDWIRSGQHG